MPIRLQMMEILEATTIHKHHKYKFLRFKKQIKPTNLPPLLLYLCCQI